MMSQFYVYRILGEMGEIVYIGKGTGSRLDRQKRRFQSDGEVVKFFASEDAAYRHERKLIALHNPPLNQDTGGCGGRFGMTNGKTFSEAGMFSSLALIIRKLAKFDRFTLIGVDIGRDMLERLVSQIAAKYDPDDFIAKLKPYNITIEFIDKSVLRTSF